MTPFDEIDWDRKLTLSEKILIRWKYRVKPALAPRRIFNRFVRFPYQRLTRGFSDQDAWNGDGHLARQIAGILTWIVEKGHAVSMSYADDEHTDVDIMVERRDKEYLHYASIFAEYGKNGPAMDEAWKNEFGGVLDSEMQEALQWLSKHFQELWD